MFTYLVIIIVLALIFDYINGFHDAANSIATIVSTKVLTPFQAVVWAAFFNFVAYFIFKDHGVANTIAKTVNEGVNEAGVPNITMTVICSGMIAAITWNLITWWYGIPSSSSHTLIGGFAGAAIAHAGFNVVDAGTILKIAAFIFLAPLLGMIVAFVISLFIMNSFRKTLAPKIVSVALIILSVYLVNHFFVSSAAKVAGIQFDKTTGKELVIDKIPNKSSAQAMGLKAGDKILSFNGQNIDNVHQLNKMMDDIKTGNQVAFGIERSGSTEVIPTNMIRTFESQVWTKLFYGENVKWLLIGFIILALSVFSLFLSSLNYLQSERWLKRMQLVSSAAFSIGHGGNDAQKVMGIITVALIASGEIGDFSEMPNWVPLACYTAIALGTMSGGWKIIKTMGTRITKVTPFEGVAAETAGALTLYFTEMLKIPVSTTHTITGSIIGVGATKRLSAVRWGVTLNLLWAWIITIPISALIAAVVYFVLSWILPLFGVDVNV